MDIFEANLRRIEQMRIDNPLATFDTNMFADLSQTEFENMYCGLRVDVEKERKAGRVAARVNIDPPDTYDWRDKEGVLAPIQDQRQCGSCWAFSATVNVESLIAVKTNTPVVKLSEQSLVDCEHNCGKYRFFNGCDAGCGGGLMQNAWKWVQSHGQPTQADYPYTGRDGSCQNATVKAHVSGWELIDVDEVAMAAYMVANGPLSIAVYASGWFAYSGGIMTSLTICPKENPNQPFLNHGVAVIGYNTDSASGTPYWIVRNSWGTGWGEKGYARILRGADYCGCALFACSSIP